MNRVAQPCSPYLRGEHPSAWTSAVTWAQDLVEACVRRGIGSGLNGRSRSSRSERANRVAACSRRRWSARAECWQRTTTSRRSSGAQSGGPLGPGSRSNRRERSCASVSACASQGGSSRPASFLRVRCTPSEPSTPSRGPTGRVRTWQRWVRAPADLQAGRSFSRLAMDRRLQAPPTIGSHDAATTSPLGYLNQRISRARRCSTE
jgi:hypothetical protein